MTSYSKSNGVTDPRHNAKGNVTGLGKKIEVSGGKWWGNGIYEKIKIDANTACQEFTLNGLFKVSNIQVLYKCETLDNGRRYYIAKLDNYENKTQKKRIWQLISQGEGEDSSGLKFGEGD